MSRKRIISNGGNVVSPDVSAPIEDVPVCPLIIVPNPDVEDAALFSAKNIEQFASKTAKTYEVELEKSDGETTGDAKIPVGSIKDTELNRITAKIEILREQEEQKIFLDKFIGNFREDEGFREEFMEILRNSKRKENLQKVLKMMQLGLKTSQPSVLDLNTK